VLQVPAHELAHLVDVLLDAALAHQLQLPPSLLDYHADAVHLVDGVHLLDAQVDASRVLADCLVYIANSAVQRLPNRLLGPGCRHAGRRLGLR
jgi:hypothetical protein